MGFLVGYFPFQIGPVYAAIVEAIRGIALIVFRPILLHFNRYCHPELIEYIHPSSMLIVTSFICTISLGIPPGRLGLCSLSGAPPPARHALEDSITIATKYALGPAPRPQYFIYVSPTERGRE